MPSSILFAALAFPIGVVSSLGASFVLVSRLERLATRLQLSEVTLGLVVALAADAPEITSAITASSHGQTGIGAGVVLGSNVFNLAALLGLAGIVAGRVDLHRRVVTLEGVTAVWVAVVSVLTVTAGFGAPAGLGLVLAGVIPYLIVSTAPPAVLRRLGLARRAVSWIQQAVAEESIELAVAIHPTKTSASDLPIAACSLAIVVFASALMERSAETLGRRFDVSNLVIGAVVLAAVTSLPNAVGAVYLASRGRGAAVLSEAMNSNMINVVAGLLVPGIFIGVTRSSADSTLVTAWYGGLTVASLGLAFAGRG
jgi:cation:H+ antiporter